MDAVSVTRLVHATTSSRHLNVVFLPPPVTDQRSGVGAGDADQRQVLDVGAVGISRAQADLLELVLEVLDGELFTFRSWCAPLELVGREHLDVLEHPRRFELRRRRDCG